MLTKVILLQIFRKLECVYSLLGLHTLKACTGLKATAFLTKYTSVGYFLAVLPSSASLISYSASR